MPTFGSGTLWASVNQANGVSEFVLGLLKDFEKVGVLWIWRQIAQAEAKQHRLRDEMRSELPDSMVCVALFDRVQDATVVNYRCCCAFRNAK